jgi:serine/threonine protein kinase
MRSNDIFNERYRLVKLLGSGAFAEVWLAEDQHIGGLDVALKIYGYGRSLSDNEIRLFTDKFRLVYNLNHNNILIPRDFGVCQGMPYLVLPYCPNGSCTASVGRLAEVEAWTFLQDVAAGLAYLHRSGIIHLDIKPDNVMISQKNDYLITDFDISVKAHKTMRKGTDNQQGTTGYMAPERFGSGAVTVQASDVWALGASVYELISGKLPFDDLGGLNQKNGAILTPIKGISKKLNNIIAECLRIETWDRPTAKHIVEWCNGKRGDKSGQWKKVLGAVAIIVVIAVSGIGLENMNKGTGGNNTKEGNESGITIVDPQPPELNEEEKAQIEELKRLIKKNIEDAEKLNDPAIYKFALRYCEDALKINPKDEDVKNLKQKIENLL